MQLVSDTPGSGWFPRCSRSLRGQQWENQWTSRATRRDCNRVNTQISPSSKHRVQTGAIDRRRGRRKDPVRQLLQALLVSAQCQHCEGNGGGLSKRLQSPVPIPSDGKRRFSSHPPSSAGRRTEVTRASCRVFNTAQWASETIRLGKSSGVPIQFLALPRSHPWILQLGVPAYVRTEPFWSPLREQNPPPPSPPSDVS